MLYYGPPGGSVDDLGAKLQRGRSVREDWLAWLPAEKERLYEATANQLEVHYSMLSVTLNEAFALRGDGTLEYARAQVGVSADLFDRFAACLLGTLRAVEDHGRHFGTLPNVAPLDPEFFRGETAQHMARRNNLLHKVLFSQRSRFFHKLRALADTVEDLWGEFRATSEEIADGAAAHPGPDWEALEVLHYDVNTCLREAIVVLKSFLCALPNEELQPFGQKLQFPVQLPPVKARAHASRG